MAEIAVFFCQGCQQGEKDRQHPEWFKEYPKEIKVKKELADIHGRIKVFLGEVYDFSDPYLRVRYPVIGRS